MRPLAPAPQETKHDLKPATNYRISVRAVNAKYGPGPTTTVPARTRGNHDDSTPPGAVVDFDVREQPGVRPALIISWRPPCLGGWWAPRAARAGCSSAGARPVAGAGASAESLVPASPTAIPGAAATSAHPSGPAPPPPRPGPARRASSYDISVKEVDDGRDLLDTTVTTTEAVVSSGVRPGADYEILLTAVNRSGRGPTARARYTTASARAARGATGEEVAEA
jgi:hypothetical protein